MPPISQLSILARGKPENIPNQNDKISSNFCDSSNGIGGVHCIRNASSHCTGATAV